MINVHLFTHSDVIGLLDTCEICGLSYSQSGVEMTLQAYRSVIQVQIYGDNTLKVKCASSTKEFKNEPKLIEEFYNKLHKSRTLPFLGKIKQKTIEIVISSLFENINETTYIVGFGLDKLKFNINCIVDVDGNKVEICLTFKNDEKTVLISVPSLGIKNYKSSEFTKYYHMFSAKITSFFQNNIDNL